LIEIARIADTAKIEDCIAQSHRSLAIAKNLISIVSFGNFGNVANLPPGGKLFLC
jgi:hypothetical protein